MVAATFFWVAQSRNIPILSRNYCNIPELGRYGRNIPILSRNGCNITPRTRPGFSLIFYERIQTYNIDQIHYKIIFLKDTLIILYRIPQIKIAHKQRAHLTEICNFASQLYTFFEGICLRTQKFVSGSHKCSCLHLLSASFSAVWFVYCKHNLFICFN